MSESPKERPEPLKAPGGPDDVDYMAACLQQAGADKLSMLEGQIAYLEHQIEQLTWLEYHDPPIVICRHCGAPRGGTHGKGCIVLEIV